ncbi:hypothetical protein GURASL_14770 [Geotalea uraniireducens]|uniref:Methyltransferase type 11 domain-containing protein n=1 Tax=Geotalea uraniireducens TaxID=351604 RepID=A0ABN6VR94_9BACT|nr:class I SAM-dependent methyltransferase [Geotalea uraniireducens]BDV42554.1 hypothetical protein GURASL_14770 [Geotalea uraniireducens]
MKKENYSAAYYDDIVAQSLGGLRKKYAKFISYVREPLQPRRIVDLGCGSGTLCAYLRERFPTAEILGLDKFETPLASARQRYPGLLFKSCDLENEDFPVESASVDLVTSHEVIEHLDSIDHFFRETCRILAPGGIMILKTPNGLDLMRYVARLTGSIWYADHDKTHRRYYDYFSVKDALAPFGFSRLSAHTGTKPLYRKGIVIIPAIPFLGNGLVVVAGK